jgi:hypothetical protein
MDTTLDPPYISPDSPFKYSVQSPYYPLKTDVPDPDVAIRAREFFQVTFSQLFLYNV